ncbi:hypothetical protein IGI04_039713 [Brassica rapa subsp. trilocularis]|uniref:Uncharacterized protein n=1 Tax=Brassica rapa subsp. trilocularis TaxID=1813537 RepID=A0ABQ7KMD1_BRACM|nr:hypothetical protein IGI04_039713 [Brassica rapa subsp. trilocularis]
MMHLRAPTSLSSLSIYPSPSYLSLCDSHSFDDPQTLSRLILRKTHLQSKNLIDLNELLREFDFDYLQLPIAL